ncbi:serine/threonine protein kinase [Calothrix sp. NIES-4071]|nr:serine/threonine protein kinase [Calothrix sp. NIES-4071]BAZ62008.1 serine/threonine protein kinase [Calothrix sp. NIES-4105]
MEVYCTRPHCPRPLNHFTDLDETALIRTAQQKYCTSCGMPLILAGRYIPTKLLGRGGFGAAFLALDRYTPAMRSCVVKQFLPAGSLSSTQLKVAQDLFEREAVVLEEIGYQHDQIPDLYAYFPVIVESVPLGRQEQFFYLVQEYINGENLEQELIQKGKFSESDAVFVLSSILKILEFVHNRGIIHRDIKPSNIMRDKSGKLFLLDFGAVKLITNSLTGTLGASTGIYSLGFAPPEQMSGGQVFPSTDLYALAVTIIILLTGKDATELFDSYTNQWKWENLVNTSRTLTSILNRMLLPAANQRFQTATDVLNALSSLQLQQAQHQHQTQLQPSQQVTHLTSKAQFSLSQILIGAGFSGLEGGLIAIALMTLIKSPAISLGISVIVISLMIFAQFRRWVGGSDLIIFPLITLPIVLYLVRASLSIPQVLFYAVIAGLISIAVTSLFRLIYKVLSMII